MIWLLISMISGLFTLFFWALIFLLTAEFWLDVFWAVGVTIAILIWCAFISILAGIVHDGAKKIWGSNPQKIRKTPTTFVILSTIEGTIGFVLVFAAVASKEIVWLWYIACSLIVYIILSFLLLRRKYASKVKSNLISGSCRQENLQNSVPTKLRPRNEKTTKDFEYISTKSKEEDSNSMEVMRHLEIIQDCIEILQVTTDPKTFFGRYRDAVIHAQKVFEIRRQRGDDVKEARELLDSFVSETEKEAMIDGFLARCHIEEKLPLIENQLNEYRKEMTPANIEYLEYLLTDEGDITSEMYTEDDTLYDDDEKHAQTVCALLRENTIIDTAFWDEMHLNFKCNLVTNYTSLQLNFEIKNTSGVPWYDGGGGITIKANIYDANGNLLAVEDVFVEDRELTHNRYSDYLYFDFDDMSKAASMEIYAYQED